jgi:hypothetical protein
MKSLIRLSAPVALLPLVAFLSACNINAEGAGAQGGGDGNYDEKSPQFVFTGRVFDGVTNTALTGYTLTIQYANAQGAAVVDGNGRYVTTPMPWFSDFTVSITKDGYRTLLSHNSFETLLPLDIRESVLGTLDDRNDVISLHYDAYLYPTTIQTPEVTFTVALGDSDRTAKGTLRAQPRSAPALAEGTGDTPAGIAGQLWANDADVQAATVTVELDEGKATFLAGSFVYGVTYDLRVFNVAGYREGTLTWRAGFDADRTITVEPLAAQPLALVYSTFDDGEKDPSARVVFFFNQTFTLDPLKRDSEYLEALDENVTINSPDRNKNAVQNVLAADESNSKRERGVGLIIDGRSLTLTWDRDRGLETDDPDDPVLSLTYGGLDQIVLRPEAGDRASAKTLAELFGAPAVTIEVD